MTMRQSTKLRQSLLSFSFWIDNLHLELSIGFTHDYPRLLVFVYLRHPTIVAFVLDFPRITWLAFHKYRHSNHRLQSYEAQYCILA